MGKCSLKTGSNHISQAELKVTAETAQRSSPREIKSEILMRRIISRGESTTSAYQKAVHQKPDRNCTGYMTENILRTRSIRNSVTKRMK